MGKAMDSIASLFDRCNFSTHLETDLDITVYSRITNTVLYIGRPASVVSIPCSETGKERGEGSSHSQGNEA
jgi:hypothetical protein